VAKAPSLKNGFSMGTPNYDYEKKKNIMDKVVGVDKFVKRIYL
jgi:hypothetical protein